MSELSNIIVTHHAKEQFRHRVLADSERNLVDVENLIKMLFTEAKYVCDNENGILFRHTDLMIEFIIRKGRIITLFPIKKRKGKC